MRTQTSIRRTAHLPETFTECRSPHCWDEAHRNSRISRVLAKSPSGKYVAVIGARSVDPGEVELIRKLGIRVFTMSEVDDRGIGAVIKEAIEIASSGTAGFHATLDMDFLDPEYAPGVGTRETGGATYRETHLAMEKIADSGQMLSVEVTEVNPLYDIESNSAVRRGVHSFRARQENHVGSCKALCLRVLWC